MKFLVDFFTVSSREKKGTLILLSLIMIISTAMQFPSVFTGRQQKSDDYSSFEKEILASIPANENFSKEIPGSEKRNGIKSSDFAKSDFVKIEKFYFDPNTAAESELINIGFFPALAKRLVAFREKGGRFFHKDDLLKVYGMSDRFYQSVEPWIRIKELPSINKNASEVRVDSKINLNTADSSALVSLPGIGPVIAARILKFREALGGFTVKSQLNEVYGLKEETINLLSERIEISGSPRRINLNSCNVEDLKIHPYFKGKLPHVIIQYREKHGLYTSVEDIKRTDLVNDELYLKIVPYLTVE